MATTIKIKNSVTATTTPTSLVQGEVAINVTDKKVWVGNAASSPVQIVGAGSGGGGAAGSNTQVQYNSSGALAGDADFTFNGTTVTMANDASISGLTVGKGGGAVASATVVGNGAMGATNTGAFNSAFGNLASALNTSGTENTSVGAYALYSNTTGSYNTAIGKQTLATNVSGGSNTAVGTEALISSTGSSNTALGRLALTSNTTASNNTAVGFRAATANTTGTELASFGVESLFSNTTGNANSAFGQFALYFNTTGSNNVAIGRSAMEKNTTASNNTAVGYQAGYSATTGGGNTFLGRFSGYSTTGIDNIFIGVTSGYYVTTGTKNTILGAYNGNQGGLDIRTASNFIVLSDGDGNPRLISESNGNVLIGTTTYSDSVKGILLSNNGRLYATAEGNPALNINRLADDGNLVLFSQAGTTEGSIAVSGTTVSYNGGHLARWSQLPDGSKDDTILKGTVLTNLDDMCVWVKDGEVLPNEQLNKMKVSDVEGDTNVAGVFVNWTTDEKCNSDDMNIAMTGDMIIRIADGVVVQKGDLLMSAGDGTAKPQGDDIVRSKTIAKVTSNYVTCTYADGSYCVPCVLMAC